MSPLMIHVRKPDGSTAIISAQVGYITDFVGASKDVTILERCKYDIKNAKAGIEVGKYRCTIVQSSRYIMISLTGGEYRPIVEIYTSFYSGMKAALEDFCRVNNYEIIENLTHKSKSTKKKGSKK